ncbi:MAG: universal stress protein [Chthoniobacterales bacterium]|nr:universal stress protein [Chthoniobacterales bacterium]
MSELHFAVAATFSPRFQAVIAEADRIARKFGARLSVLHAGERSDEKVKKFRESFAELGRAETDIYWCEGATPAEALLDAASSEYFDLLIVGAINHENDLRNFTSDVVRELLQRAPCDLLFLPSPTSDEPTGNTTACLMVEAHQPRWQLAQAALAAIKPEKIAILAADSPFAHAKGAALGREEDLSAIDQLLESLEKIAPEVDLRTVKSNTGFILCDIVQEAAPDFLIVEAEWKNRCRILPPHLDWLKQVIPARLFLLGKPPRDDSQTIKS